MPALGTRTTSRTLNGYPSGRQPNAITTADQGLAPLAQNVSATFTASNGQVTCANGTFATGWSVGTPIEIIGSNLNAGSFIVNGLDATNQSYLVLYPPPKDEGPINVTIRTI